MDDFGTSAEPPERPFFAPLSEQAQWVSPGIVAAMFGTLILGIAIAILYQRYILKPKAILKNGNANLKEKIHAAHAIHTRRGRPAGLRPATRSTDSVAPDSFSETLEAPAEVAPTPETTSPPTSSHELNPGIRLRLTLPARALSFTATVINVGEEGIVITLPKFDDEDAYIESGDLVDGYMRHDEMRYSFQTYVGKIYHGGLRACTLKHTDAFSMMCRREQPRAVINTPAIFTYLPAHALQDSTSQQRRNQDPQEELPAMIHDLSMGGCLMTTRAPDHFEPGSLLEITTRFPGDETFFTLTARILRTSALHDGPGSQMNLEFLGLDNETNEILDKTLHRLLWNEAPPPASESNTPRPTSESAE